MEGNAQARWLENRRGAAAMAAAMVLIVINDTMIKLVSETLPAAQTIGLRGIFATAMILVVVLARGHRNSLPHLLDRRTITRAVLDVLSTFTYLVSLFHMPIAAATAINMAAPLMMVGAAALMLREAVPFRRWAAVLAGFAGMLLIIRPGGDSFNAWAALALFGTAVNAMRDLYTRRIGPHVPSLIITLATSIAVTVMGVGVTGLQGWQPVSPFHVALLAAAAVFLSVAYYLMIIAMRLGDASVIGGFRYSALPAAAATGWLVWGQLPDGLAFAGMAVLVAAGMWLMRVERRAAHR